MARLYAQERSDVRIDPYETEHHVGSDFIAVRAWILVPLAEETSRSAALIATRKLAKLPSVTQRIFHLSASYGLTVAEIASVLSLSHRHVRKHLVQAIAALDVREA
jgi:RNA polymerase sigma-70 factor (ECF subfamily)